MSRREVGKLVMSQFRSRTRVGRRKSLLQEAEKILRSGAVEQPAWFPGLKACVPAPDPPPALARSRARAEPASSPPPVLLPHPPPPHSAARVVDFQTARRET